MATIITTAAAATTTTVNRIFISTTAAVATKTTTIKSSSARQRFRTNPTFVERFFSSSLIANSTTQTTTTTITRPTNTTTMLVLCERDIRQALHPQTCLDVNYQALVSITDHTAVVPSRLAISYPNNPYNSNDDNNGQDDNVVAEDWTLIKPAAYYGKNNENDDTDNDNDPTIGLKVVSVRANNPSNGLPLVPATILLLDSPSGIVRATLAGTYITIMRTSAGPALAVQHFQPHCNHVVIFGAGSQAECHIQLIELALNRRIPTITIINRTLSNAINLQTKIMEQRNQQQEQDDESSSSLSCVVNAIALDDTEGVASALLTADVICTTTNTTTPLWGNNDEDEFELKDGCLITSIGSYTPNMQEIPPYVVDQCHVIIDTPETLAVGDLKHLNRTSIDPKDDDDEEDYISLAGTAFQNPQRILDKVRKASGSSGSDSANDPTHRSQRRRFIFYKAVGTAIQDVLTAKAVMDNAIQHGLGQEVDMS